MKKDGDNSFGIVGVSIGIVSLVLSLSNQIVSIILGIVAIVLSNKQNHINKNDWCKWGKNLGIASIIISVILIIVALIVIAKNPQVMEQLSKMQA